MTPTTTKTKEAQKAENLMLCAGTALDRPAAREHTTRNPGWVKGGGNEKGARYSGTGPSAISSLGGVGNRMELRGKPSSTTPWVLRKNLRETDCHVHLGGPRSLQHQGDFGDPQRPTRATRTRRPSKKGFTNSGRCRTRTPKRKSFPGHPTRNGAAAREWCQKLDRCGSSPWSLFRKKNPGKPQNIGYRRGLHSSHSNWEKFYKTKTQERHAYTGKNCRNRTWNQEKSPAPPHSRR